MEKQKPWQFYLIIAVIALTLYNILPTLFYYTKPLSAPVNAERAHDVATGIVERVNSLEQDSQEWIYAFSKLLGLKPQTVQVEANNPGLIAVTFPNAKDAEKFKSYLPRAGTLIPFVPAQLDLSENPPGSNPNTVFVARQIHVKFDPNETDQLFHFSQKYDENGDVTPFYRDLVNDRATQIALGFAGPSQTALQLIAITENSSDPQYDDMVLSVAKAIIDVDNSLGKSNGIAKRYFASFTQGPKNEGLIDKFVARAETLKLSLSSKKDALDKEQKQLLEKGQFISSDQAQQVTQLDNQILSLENAIAVIKRNQTQFQAGLAPLTSDAIHASLEKSASTIDPKDKIQVLSLENRNPFVQSLLIDWNNSAIELQLYPDVTTILESSTSTEASAYLKEKMNQYVIQEIAKASRLSDEQILPYEGTYAVTLDTLPNTQSIMTLDVGYIAAKRTQQLTDELNNIWNPHQADLARDTYPIMTYDTYKTLKPEEQKLGLVVYAPAMTHETPPAGFRTSSIYVIARGMDAIVQKYQQTPNNEDSQAVLASIKQLNSLLQQKGFIGYPGSAYGIDPAYRKDYIFELDDYYSMLLKATREDFVVKGSKRAAVLDFSDVEQRMLTLNKIDDRIQEDLLKWKEEYNTAQIDPQSINRYLIPPPTENPYWQNFKTSFVKYFRGDDRKILKWGLDLSGGKTVRIGLRDRNGKTVTNPEDLKQAVNELYTRVNKMGVSERTIHIENNNIILDFPGSQNLSAADLIKASAMYFHIVNHKFNPSNPALNKSVQQFLQDVWNEAVVTNRKDIDSVNAIAWQHLGGNANIPGESRPISDSARDLFDNGLRLANPKEERMMSSAFNDTISSIAMLRGDEPTEWEGQPHPLTIVFHNYALEGSSLTDIQVGYDPTQGNVLTFSVKRSYEGSQGGSPRDDFYAWTSQFAEDKIVGTPKEAYSQGHGWRMAVILNDRIVSAPTLRAALRDGATISGRFSQREVSQLAADLKAGSLSFTPQILSEETVSPELGREERTQGIIASIVALLLVFGTMILSYHFAGVVASCAVLFNILIMWGVLQNLGAALTLPGIAGFVLTVGLAVDANVLIFERIREEFSHSGRIASAIQAGYRKAFSAIIDSNVTTIIAALVLIQFDSGPIKGFAVTLIVGIISSLFTALFMTRYFFAGWVQDPNHKSLSMAHFIGKTNFDFLAKAKPAILISLAVILMGAFFFVEQRKTMFGMDFTGGYSLNVELVEDPSIASYRVAAIDSMLAHGATTNDVQVRELSQPNHLRIQLGTGMEEKGHPFYQMPEMLQEGIFANEYQKNPRINWLVESLASANLHIVPSQLEHIQNQWTVISGQLSDTMRNNAIAALSIALLCVLIYITLRFEFKFAIAAIVALIHDVIITIGLMALFHQLGFPVQIDLQVIGAIMMIIGYSLNDTIIVFDRIREDIHVMRKMSFYEIINHALNVTLSRTIMTSGITLLVLLTLVFLGGKSIFGFSLVMTIGILVGTTSSWFIASPMLLWLHNREVRAQETLAAQRR